MVDPVNSSLIHRTLPFPVRQTIFLDPILATSDESGTVTLAVVDDKGDVILVGGETTARFEKQIAPTRLNDELTTQTRLFEEIFGKVAEVESASKVVIQVGEKKRTLGSGLEALDAPAHTLPPPRLLWRSMLGNFASVTTSKTVEKGRPEAEEEATKMDVDSSEPVAEVYSSVSKLMDVFKARFSLSGQFLSSFHHVLTLKLTTILLSCNGSSSSTSEQVGNKIERAEIKRKLRIIKNTRNETSKKGVVLCAAYCFIRTGKRFLSLRFLWCCPLLR